MATQITSPQELAALYTIAVHLLRLHFVRVCLAVVARMSVNGGSREFPGAPSTDLAPALSDITSCDLQNVLHVSGACAKSY